jgi:type II secretory ATPase GspE/PulE/Tfp pilus assembly ATPase PilB-like protein
MSDQHKAAALDGAGPESIDWREAVAQKLVGQDPERATAILFEYAASLPASDVFFQTNEEGVAVAVRYLGFPKVVASLPRDEGRRLMGHIKALAGMDISTRLRPEDGRWVHPLAGGRMVDLRINAIPTMYGEDMAVRLLDRELGLLGLEHLGLARQDLSKLRSMLASPGGLILVTGPTGSGKTTTLYACLQVLNDGTRKINTIEDPVEYALEGVRQSQVNLRMELDFPELLRSVLRQAPDVIMVGEIRDPITAETAVRAANSGHLVLATLHAATAPGAADSMLAMGVHPHFLSSGLLGILAQRLVRTLCPKCKLSVDISESPLTFEEVRKLLQPGQGHAIYTAHGCPECRQEGFVGRTGVFEVLRVSREVRRLIAERRTVREIREQAVKEGMLDVRRAALLKVAEGATSAEETLRAIPSEHLLPDEESVVSDR